MNDRRRGYRPWRGGNWGCGCTSVVVVLTAGIILSLFNLAIGLGASVRVPFTASKLTVGGSVCTKNKAPPALPGFTSRRPSAPCCWRPPTSARRNNWATSSSSTTSSRPIGAGWLRPFPSTRSGWTRARRHFSGTNRPLRRAQAPRPRQRYMRVIMPRFSHRLALKIVLPFAALTLAIGAVGTLTATGELSSRSQGAFDAQLVHDGIVAQSMVKTGDSERRANPRLPARGARLSQNWDKTTALQAWLERALTIHPNVIVEVVDTSGREIVGVVGHGAFADTVTRSHDLSSWPGLSYMLSGGASTIDLVASAPQPAIFTGQPVRNAADGLIGAILVGDYLDDRAGTIKASLPPDDITFYDVHGQVLPPSLSIPPSQWPTLALDVNTRGRISPTSVVELPRAAGGPGTEIVSPWEVRATNLGYVGTVGSTAGLLADTNQLRIILVTLFLARVLFTLAIGIWLARRITRPVHRLVEATRLVSAGDLDHQAPVTTHDEIGELTDSFNHMTRSLQEQSASRRTTMTQVPDH